MWVFDGQNIGQSDLCSYTLHLLKQSHLRVHFLGEFLHPLVVFLDVLVQRFDFFQQRRQNLAQLRAQSLGQLLAHLIGATLGQSLAIRLHQPPCCVHQGRSSTHQFRPRPDHRQVELRLQPCQCPSIVPIILPITLGDQLHLLRVRHDHLVSQLREQPAYPSVNKKICAHGAPPCLASSS